MHALYLIKLKKDFMKYTSSLEKIERKSTNIKNSKNYSEKKLALLVTLL